MGLNTESQILKLSRKAGKKYTDQNIIESSANQIGALMAQQGIAITDEIPNQGGSTYAQLMKLNFPFQRSGEEFQEQVEIARKNHLQHIVN